MGYGESKGEKAVAGYFGLAGGVILRPGERLAKPPWGRGGVGGRRTCFQPGIWRRLTG